MLLNSGFNEGGGVSRRHDAAGGPALHCWPSLGAPGADTGRCARGRRCLGSASDERQRAEIVMEQCIQRKYGEWGGRSHKPAASGQRS